MFAWSWHFHSLHPGITTALWQIPQAPSLCAHLLQQGSSTESRPERLIRDEGSLEGVWNLHPGRIPNNLYWIFINSSLTKGTKDAEQKSFSTRIHVVIASANLPHLSQRCGKMHLEGLAKSMSTIFAAIDAVYKIPDWALVRQGSCQKFLDY